MLVAFERNPKLIKTSAHRLLFRGDGGHAVGIMIDVTPRTG
jgi:hypothetical protein